MTMPGLSDEKDVKVLLKKLLSSPDEVVKFAVVARGPKDGELVLSKTEKLKKKDVQAAAEEEAKERNGGKAVRVDVMVGECRLHKAGQAVLRLSVYGKAIAKAVACAEHLVVRGPYKTIGFTDVILEEVDESDEIDEKGTGSSATPSSPSKPEQQAPPPSQLKPTQSSSPEVALAFNQRLSALLPKVKSAAGTAAGDAAKLKASEAGMFARKGDFDQAQRLLDEAEQALSSAGNATATPKENDEATQFTARLKSVKPRLDEAIASGTAQGQEIKLRASEMGVAVRKKDYALAQRLLDQLEEMLAMPASSSSGDTFARQWAEAKVTWRDLIELVDDQINQVRGAMLSSGDPELKRIADQGLPALTANHKTPVMKALFDLDAATGDSRGKAAAAAQKAIAAFRKHLSSDARIRVLDEDSREAFGVALTIRESIGKGLDALEQALRPVLAS